MATHSSILAWRIPWTEEPGGLQSMESQKVRHNWSDLAQHKLRTERGVSRTLAVVTGMWDSAVGLASANNKHPSNACIPARFAWPDSSPSHMWWVPLPHCSPLLTSLPRCPFPIKSLALSACVSPQTIHFWVLDKNPLLGPERGRRSYNIWE